MDGLKHLFPRNTASTEKYIYAGPRGGGEFALPPRDDRVGHGSKLVTEIQTAVQAANDEQATSPEHEKPKGVCLDFQSDPGFKLQLDSLESRRSGIELRNSRTDKDGVMHGTVFVPDGKIGNFVRKFERYATENDATSGKPKNKVLVESIQAIRLASLRSFWTDAGDFPDTREPVWWEIWLRKATNPHDAADLFRQRAQAAVRVKGSVHSDTWTGTAAELADCGVIAVFPVTGWWNERAHLNRWNCPARYSLVVTIETDSTDVDVYTPIATQIGLPVETAIET